MYPNYTEMILQPLLNGLQSSANEMFSFMGGFLPVVLPITGALALIYLVVGIFKGIVNQAMTESHNSEFMDSMLDYDTEDLMSDYFLFDGAIDYQNDDDLGEWIDIDYGDE